MRATTSHACNPGDIPLHPTGIHKGDYFLDGCSVENELCVGEGMESCLRPKPNLPKNETTLQMNMRTNSMYNWQ